MSDFYSSCARRHLSNPASVGYVDILARRARVGGREEMQELCEHLGCIAEAATTKRIQIAAFRGLERDDLRQEAMRAMIEALWAWDPNKASFRTFAYARAHFAVLDVINRAHLVTVPKQYGDAVMRNPEQAEFAKLSDYAKSAAVQAVQSTTSFSGLLKGKDGDEEDFDPIDVERGYEEAMTRLAFEQVFRRTPSLTEAEKKVLAATFGLLGEPVKTQREIGKEIGASGAWAGRLLARALQKLQKSNTTPATRRMAS